MKLLPEHNICCVPRSP